MPEITLTHVGGNRTFSIDMPAPQGPYSPDENANQNFSASGKGVIRITELGDPEYLIRMNFVRLSRIEYDRLKLFIEVTLQESRYPFTLEDHQGARENMYYIDGLDTHQISQYDLVSVSLNFFQGVEQGIMVGTNIGDFDLDTGEILT